MGSEGTIFPTLKMMGIWNNMLEDKVEEGTITLFKKNKNNSSIKIL